MGNKNKSPDQQDQVSKGGWQTEKTRFPKRFLVEVLGKIWAIIASNIF